MNIKNIWQDKKVKMESVTFKNVLNLFFLLVTLCGVLTSIYMNFVNRSLWLDEAMLADSFSNRSFWRLWDGIFDRNQSAPLGWLYIEKILSILFGNTEFVLRIGSIMGFAGTLVLLYYLLAKCFHTEYALAGCAFYANMPFILKYSNVFKPYICDGFFVLLVILVFYQYERGKLKSAWLAALWAVLIWFSNPTCFFEGGLLLSGAGFALYEKNWKKLKNLIVTAAVIIASFLVYYFFWLREVAVGDAMQNYWAGQNFPLIPTSVDDLYKMGSMIFEIFRQLRAACVIFLGIMLISFPLICLRKNKILIGCYIGIVITCFASMINMFPVEDRMWCFFYPLAVLMVFAEMEELTKTKLQWQRFTVIAVSILVMPLVYYITKNVIYAGIEFLLIIIAYKFWGKTKKQCFLGVFCFCLVICNAGILTYLHSENVYWYGEELNPEIEWLHENVEADDMVYVYYHSTAGFQYKNGYGNLSIGGYDGNVILGTTFFTEGLDCGEEIKKITEQDKIYIACSHYSTERLAQLLDAVHENGYFELIRFDYGTPLWYYCRDIADSKLHVDYELISQSENGNIVTAVIRIYNNGEAWLNHQYETVSLVNKTDGVKTSLEKNIAPESFIDVEVQYEKGTSPVFQLENEYGVVSQEVFAVD